MKIYTEPFVAVRYFTRMGMHMVHTILRPALYPCRMRSVFLVPMFWATKLDIPFPSVVKDVITRLFNVTDTEYPTMVPVSYPLIMPWITIFPMGMKLCWRMLGMAITEMSLSRLYEKKRDFYVYCRRENLLYTFCHLYTVSIGVGQFRNDFTSVC